MKSIYLKLGLPLLVVAGLIATLSCVKSSTSSGTVPGPSTNLVKMVGNSFSPSSITVTLPSSGGVTVTWRNDDAYTTHTATSDNGVFNTGDILPGQTKSFTFTAKGTFPYHCVYHQAMGMTGTVVVQ